MDTLNRKYAINLSVFLLVLLMAWLLGRLFWSLYNNAQPELVMPSLQPPINQSFSSNKVLAPVHLFGKSQDVKDQPKAIEKDVQKTRLKLKLLGVLVMPDMGVAIIEKASKSYSYSLEEEIQNGVILKEVHPAYVVISHNGVLEKLQMAKDEVVFTQSDEQTTDDLSAKQVAILKSVKTRVQTNPISILRYVRFEMINKTGKQTIKVWPRKEVEIFKALGFQSGDEVTIVNGYSVAELVKSPGIWQALMKESNLNLTLIRKGQTQSISVKLD